MYVGYMLLYKYCMLLCYMEALWNLYAACPETYGIYIIINHRKYFNNVKISL